MQKLNKDLEKIIEGFAEKADKETPYPYKVFSAKRISEDDGRQIYSLEVNVWDQGQYYSRAESIMDALEKKLHRCNLLTEECLLCFFKGQRQPIDDPDKTIKRIREQFEMHVFEREDE